MTSTKIRNKQIKKAYLLQVALISNSERNQFVWKADKKNKLGKLH